MRCKNSDILRRFRHVGCYFSECSVSLNTWLFEMIIIDIPNKNRNRKETLLLVIVYCMPGPLELPTQHKILIVVDFDLDQLWLENAAKVDPLIQSFKLCQLSQYSTDIHGGLLDLVFDTSNSNVVSFQPSPYSEHFLLFFQI